MYQLTLNATPAEIDAARAEFTGHTARTLAGLRDDVVAVSKQHRIDISDRFLDQFYEVFPWELTAEDKKDMPPRRRVTESLILDLAGSIYGISPGKFDVEVVDEDRDEDSVKVED